MEDNTIQQDQLDGELESKAKSLPPIKNCRFYENEFPEVNEIVMVRIDSLNDFCAFVTLLEYNLPASIQFTEISNRRLRQTPSSLLKIGKQEVMQVLRVDEEKGYIDLTKKNVDAKEIAECTEKFNKSKTVHSILAHVVSDLQATGVTLELEDLYLQLIWPVYRTEKFEHPIEAFQQAVSDKTVFDEYELDATVKTMLVKDISHRLATQQVKVQATVEVTCFTYEGIDAIIPALRAGREVASSKSGSEVKIALISTPLYSIATNAKDRDSGLKAVQSAIDTIKEEIEKRKGALKVASEPAVVTV